MPSLVRPFLLATVLSLPSVPALADDPSPAGLQSVPVAEGLYLLTGTEGGNVAYLVTDEGVLVVDAGTAPAEGAAIVAAVRRTTEKPIRYVVLTHYHGDHTMGLQAFPRDAIVVAHENTARSIRRFAEADARETVEKELPAALEQARKKLETARATKGADMAAAEKELASLQGYVAAMKELRIVHPGLTFTGSATIVLGGQEVRLLYTGPAHTDGNVIVRFEGKKVVHMGDVFFHRSLPYIDGRAGCDTANWIAQVRALLSTDVETVIPGHGPLAKRADLQPQVDYLEALRRAVREGIGKGLDVAALQASITLPEFAEWAYRQILPANVEVVYGELKAAK